MVDGPVQRTQAPLFQIGEPPCADAVTWNPAPHAAAANVPSGNFQEIKVGYPVDAVAAERERCAKIAESFSNLDRPSGMDIRTAIAARIRGK